MFPSIISFNFENFSLSAAFAASFAILAGDLFKLTSESSLQKLSLSRVIEDELLEANFDLGLEDKCETRRS